MPVPHQPLPVEQRREIRIAYYSADLATAKVLIRTLAKFGYTEKPPVGPASDDKLRAWRMAELSPGQQPGVKWCPLEGHPATTYLVVVGDTPWTRDPFNGDWSVDAGGISPPVVIVRLADIPYPPILYPILDGKGFEIATSPIVDVFRNRKRLAPAVLEALNLVSKTPEIAFAEGVISAGPLSSQILSRLSEASKTTTVAALQTVDTRLDTRLATAIAAISQRDAKSLKEVLADEEHRTSILAAQMAGQATLLHLACIIPDSTDIISVLLHAGIDANSANEVGSTPLMLSCWNNPEVALLLIENGADPTRVSAEGRTALAGAAWKGRAALVSELLVRGCSPLITDDSLGHPLLWAAAAGHLDVARILLEYDATLVSLRTGTYGMGSLDPAFSPNAPDILDFTRWRRQRALESDLRGQTALHSAAARSLPGVCEFLLRHGADPNMADVDGRLPLHHAILSFQNEVDLGASISAVTNLIKAKSAVNIADRSGYSPFLLAVAVNFLEGARLLATTAIADVNTANLEGRGAGHLAATGENPALITELASWDVNLNTPDLNGFRPLALAVRYGQAAHVTALLKCRVDTEGTDKLGRTPLFQLNAADVDERAEKARLLKAFRARFDRADSEGVTPLIFACASGPPGHVALLLELGADPNIADKRQVHPLHAAAIRGKSEDIQALLAKNAAVNVVDSYGDTPLLEAVRHERLEAIELLLEAGADPWMAGDNKAGERALSAGLMASRVGKAAAGQAILKRFDISRATSLQCREALICAIAIGDGKLVADICNAGYSPNLAPQGALRPLAVAALNGHPQIMKLLLEYDAEANWPPGTPLALTCAAEAGNIAGIELLVARGANPNQPGPSGMTPLHFAAAHGQLSALEALLRAGSFVDPVNEHGRTPLHLASIKGSNQCITALLAAGAVLSALDKEGNTPLHVAAYHGQAAAVEVLTIAGVRIDALNAAGETPLFLAAQQGMEDCVRRLLAARANPRHMVPAGFTAAEVASNAHHQAIVKLLTAAGAELPAPVIPETARADFLKWRPMPAREQEDFIIQARDQIPHTAAFLRTAQLQLAELSFYQDATIVAVADQTLPTPNERFFLWSAPRGRTVAMNWTNEPLFLANDLFDWHVDRRIIFDYVKFFFFFVRGKLGRFNIVEPGDALPWIPSSHQDERIIASVEPMRCIEETQSAMRLRMHVVFKNALFASDCFVALTTEKHDVEGNGELRDMTRGEMSLVNETLLYEDLPFMIAAAPNEFG